MSGKNYLDELQVDRLGAALNVDAALKGSTENPIAYLQRTSMNFDGADMVSDRVTVIEPFSLLPQRVGAGALTAPNPHFELTGTNVATSLQAFVENGVSVTTAGALGDQVVCAPISGQTLWANSLAAGLHPLCRFRVKTVSDDDVRYELGVRSTVNAFDDTTDTDKMLVRFDTSDGVVSNTNFVLVTSNNGVDVIEDTGIALLPNGDYSIVLATTRDSTRNVFCFINDVLANDPSAHTMRVTNIGTPYGAVEALAAAGKNWRLQGFSRSLTI